VSKRNSGRRGRPRKRKSGTTRLSEGASAVAGASVAGEAAATAASPRAARTGAGEGRASSRSDGRPRGARRPLESRPGERDPGGVGERPQAPWHPWPFSELLILVGAIGTIVGFSTQAPPLLVASLGAVLLGTLEFTIREHRTGYRSHSTLLAAVPTALLHGGVALALFALGVNGELLVVLPLLLDVPVFWFLFRFLRARFEDARRERVFALKHR
jgi:hypothetical protein